MLASLSKWYAQPTNQQGMGIVAATISAMLLGKLTWQESIIPFSAALALFVKNDNTASTAANAAVAAGAAPLAEATKAAGVATLAGVTK